MTKRQAKRCSHCKKAIPKNSYGIYDSMLRVSLDGGYAEFTDVIVFAHNRGILMKYPLYHYICHKCAHELVKWLNIPDEEVHRWHPKTEDDFCNGWTIDSY